MAVCIVDFAVGSPKVDCCSLCRKRNIVVYDSEKINVAATRIGSTAAQHPQPTEDECCDNAKILDRAYISDEMDSIKLSKRGTEDEREYCVGRSEMARPSFYTGSQHRRRGMRKVSLLGSGMRKVSLVR